MKTIAKVIGNKTYERVGKDLTDIDVSIIDTLVPAIIYHPNTQEYVHGNINQIYRRYPIGTILEIESTFHQVGETLHGHTFTHDCYSRNIKVVS